MCDYSNAHIVVKRTIGLLAGAINENDKPLKAIALRNNTPFRSFMSKIDSTLVENSEDLQLVVPMYNLLEHSGNYSMASASFGTITEMKCITLMIILQKTNHLSIRQKQ